MYIDLYDYETILNFVIEFSFVNFLKGINTYSPIRQIYETGAYENGLMTNYFWDHIDQHANIVTNID